MKRLIITLVASLLSLPTYAVVITHGSSGGVFTQNDGANSANSSNYDRAEFTFAAEFAENVTLANFGYSAIAHDHGNTRFAEVDVFDGANWINVFSTEVLGTTLLSSLFASQINFAGMSISGIRMDVDFPVQQAYHSVSQNMTYTTSVPEPLSVALLGLGLAVIGIRRKRFLQ